MIHTAADLLTIARTYSEAVGVPLSTVGLRAAGNDKVFTGLAKGKSCLLATAEMAGFWFSEYWPQNVEWPDRIFRPHVSQEWRRRLVLEEKRRSWVRRPRPSENHVAS